MRTENPWRPGSARQFEYKIIHFVAGFTDEAGLAEARALHEAELSAYGAQGWEIIERLYAFSVKEKEHVAYLAKREMPRA
jgi:hypothetical protein